MTLYFFAGRCRSTCRRRATRFARLGLIGRSHRSVTPPSKPDNFGPRAGRPPLTSGTVRNMLRRAGCLRAGQRRGVLHGADDLVVAGAAAQIAGQLEANVVLAGIRVRSSSALAATIKPGVQMPHCKAAPSKKHCCKGCRCVCAAMPSIVVIWLPFDLDRQHQATIHRHAVQNHGAGAAVAVVAAFLGAGRVQRSRRPQASSAVVRTRTRPPRR